MNEDSKGQISLQVTIDRQVVFESSGKWLYPLFDLEDFLKSNPLPMKDALVQDKVIGKAAALLMIRLGAGKIHGNLMSELADQALTHAQIPHTCERLVPQIECRTEEVLKRISDPEAAYRILCKRAKRC